MGLIYLDSCIVIYLLEPRAAQHNRVRTLVAAERGRRLCISPLVKAECLVGPMRTGDFALQAAYEVFFSTAQTLDMQEPVFVNAARLRARFNLKMPDALHLACAQRHACDALWTNDTRLNAAAGGLARALTV